MLRTLSETSLCASGQSKVKALENVGPQLHLVTVASQPRENVWRRTEHPDRSLRTQMQAIALAFLIT